MKIFCIDTNVLIHDPMAMLAFHEHHVVIPYTVLSELDGLKDSGKDVSREARVAINMIDKILLGATPEQIQSGVEIPDSAIGNSPKGRLSIFSDDKLQHRGMDNLKDSKQNQKNDRRIINVALHLQDEQEGSNVTLVSRDICMRIQAKGLGLANVEDYRNDQLIDDIKYLASGYMQLEGKFWDLVTDVKTDRIDNVTVHTIPVDSLSAPYVNQFVIDNNGFAGMILEINSDHILISDISKEWLMNQCFWGIKPKNLEQAMAMYLLSHDDMDMTVMTGPAGSGKTLLALAYGIHAVLEEHKYDKIIVTRNLVFMDEDIGYLPGGEAEKLEPIMMSFVDNLEVMHSGDESPFGSIEYVKEKANIQFRAMAYMRGRSFNRSYIIIDEAQGLTPFQVKSLVSRVGEDSKIVFLGNLAQIDGNKYITPLTSGLTHLVEKSKDFKYSGIMHVNGIVRSRLAAFAEENM
jgi:PhoH-like ATPase